MKRSFVQTFTKWIYAALRTVIRNPKYRWWAIAGSLVYLLSPFDIAPDALPIVGWIDDGLLATIVITEVSQLLMDRRKAQKSKSNQATNDATVVDVDSMTIS